MVITFVFAFAGVLLILLLPEPSDKSLEELGEEDRLDTPPVSGTPGKPITA